MESTGTMNDISHDYDIAARTVEEQCVTKNRNIDDDDDDATTNNVGDDDAVEDIDSTAAIVVEHKNGNNQHQTQYSSNNHYHPENDDDTSTIATTTSSSVAVVVDSIKTAAVAATVEVAVAPVPPRPRPTGGSSCSNSTTTTTSTILAETALPPLRHFRSGLFPLLKARRNDDNDNGESYADEKKHDDSEVATTTSSSDEVVPLGPVRPTANDQIMETTQQCLGTVAKDDVIDAMDSTNDDETPEDAVAADEEPLLSSTDKKQQRRRDLFLTIHKEVRSSQQLQPPPPRPVGNVVDFDNKNHPNGPSSVQLKLDNIGKHLDSTKQRPKGHMKPSQDDPHHQNQQQAVSKRVKRETSEMHAIHDDRGDDDIGKPPKAPLYAYELFTRDYLRAYKAMNREAAGMDQDTLNAMTLQEWKDMSDTAKKPYITRATQDQQVYHQQVQIWEQRQSSSSSSATNDVVRGSYINDDILQQQQQQSLPNPTNSQQPNTNHENFNPRPRGRPKLAFNPMDRDANGIDIPTNNDSNLNSARPRGRPKLVTETNVDDSAAATAAAGSLSPQPRGRPKTGHVWDSRSGQWMKSSNDEATDEVAIREKANIANAKENIAVTKDSDDRWYTQLQSTPTLTNPSGKEQQQLPIAQGYGSDAQQEVTKHPTVPKSRKQQNILNPKRAPKINQDGSYRKPGGPQPVGYKWDAEYGYWESVIASDSNLQRILDFDDDNDVDKTLVKSEPQGRRQSTGSALSMAQRKRKYTDDGCIVPKQTLDRSRDGTYVRPMGRPIVGYAWDALRGVWTPSTQGEHQANIEEKPQRKQMSVATAGNKTRLYTSDGCILPIKTPVKADDGTFIRPFGRSIVGYAWDQSRGVWAPNGGPIPTKNALPVPPSHYPGPIRLVGKLQVDESKYVACTKCDACTMKENCGTCLYCMILLGKTNAPPYLVCSYRICQEPVLNPKYTGPSSGKNTTNHEGIKKPANR